MKANKVFTQEIAVFGESGSGKTVLVSSFYGRTQEPEFLSESLFEVAADRISDGNRLHRNYLGMRRAAQVPEGTRFESRSYAFTVKVKDAPGSVAERRRPFDALRLVWHDYPGEWFEQDVEGEEARRRVDTFRSLLGADVALLLVDGQRLLDHQGEEERYLKSLFGSFRNGLLSLKDDLLGDGKALVEFPRIWVLALSKADLLPDVDVFAFRDLLIEKAADDIEELRKAIARFVEAPQALSVGEDFMLLSSAKFEPGRIMVTEQVGVDLVLPLAATLPLERHVRWTEAKTIPVQMARQLLGGATDAIGLATMLLGKVRLPGRLGAAVGLATTLFGRGGVADSAVRLADGRLQQIHDTAVAKHDYMTAVLTKFRIALAHAERDRVLKRSSR